MTKITGKLDLIITLLSDCKFEISRLIRTLSTTNESLMKVLVSKDGLRTYQVFIPGQTSYYITDVTHIEHSLENRDLFYCGNKLVGSVPSQSHYKNVEKND